MNEAGVGNTILRLDDYRFREPLYTLIH